ncbi:glucokinase [Serratia sp. UGAL515B_01]|uniref:glucokinase n=1 Tax=Serratia sp. UGAL515B_01 TaxID=2986763 RepID=UPI002955D5BD|nr:glucokinase [Serratia sp. UGAL515B_01]WON78946.1 glucokinase [Serratia sp. UGAL515B_01]
MLKCTPFCIIHLMEKTAMTYALVGDVGGTNARFALCSIETGEITQSKTYSGLEFDSLEAVIRQYLGEQQLQIQDACIAIACPVTEDWVAMTNHSWAFSISAMKTSLGLKHLEVINDFTAVSMAIPMLSEADVLQFGGAKAQKDKPIAVYGAGTGLGVAHLVHVNRRWVSLPGEGGHVDFAPNSEEEDIILKVLRSEVGHVSAERVLSGPGLVNLYRAIVKADNRLPEKWAPKDITERALAESCTDCLRALSLFCVILGRFGGNLALNLGTFGGVYIAGGIVPRFMEFFKASGFRAAFEDKGRFKDYVKPIPVFMITHSQPGLLGAGAHLRQTMGIDL